MSMMWMSLFVSFVMYCVLDLLFMVWFADFYFFFFKQKTAYELRISDWSSDVCSSDLEHDQQPKLEQSGMDYPQRHGLLRAVTEFLHEVRSEERRVRERVSVRVDLGGRRIIKEKKTIRKTRVARETINY